MSAVQGALLLLLLPIALGQAAEAVLPPCCTHAPEMRPVAKQHSHPAWQSMGASELSLHRR